MNDLKKLENETEEQYLWKIGQLVDSGKVESWSSINDIVNKELLGDDETVWRTESAWRKRYQSAKKFYDGCFSKMESNEYSDKLEEQRREIEKQRQKLYVTKTEYTRQIRQQSRFELFYENIADEINTLNVPEFIGLDYSANYKEYIISIADIHAGANFITETYKYSFEEIT